MPNRDLDALVRQLAERTGGLIARHCAPMEARIADLERQVETLRKARANPGGRRHFTHAEPDPAAPGCCLLHFDDGAVMSLPDERLSALAGVAAVGRA